VRHRYTRWPRIAEHSDLGRNDEEILMSLPPHARLPSRTQLKQGKKARGAAYGADIWRISPMITPLQPRAGKLEQKP
jgi:hypothetical protein